MPKDRRTAVERLRATAVGTLPGFTEGIEYGMPYYRRGGTQAIAFASQRRHIAVYAGEEALAAHRGRLAGLDVGKGCLRFRRPEEIDWSLIEDLFRSVADGRFRSTPPGAQDRAR